MYSPVSKIMNLIDKLPAEERMIIAKSYYIKDEKEMSPKVIKLKKVYDKLSDDEKNEFITFCWARMLDTEDTVDVWIVAEVSVEDEPDLSE